jgi:hypothetical protein
MSAFALYAERILPRATYPGVEKDLRASGAALSDPC